MNLSAQLLEAASGVVVRPKGWEAANDVPDGWTRAGHLYRGMTGDEFAYVKRKREIRSTQRWSIAGEGTNFSGDAGDAESYVNYGRTDPRKTGQPTYVVEVTKDDSFVRGKDGYWKTPAVPAEKITRIWKMVGADGAVVATQTRL